MLRVTKKYIIAFDKDLKDKILHLMKKDWHLEVLECDRVKQLEANNTELQETDYLLSSVDFSISLLSRFEEKISLLEKLKNPRIIIKKDEADTFEKEEDLKKTVEGLVKTEKEIKTIEKKIKDNNEKIKELEQFGSLKFVPRETEYTKSLIFKTDKVEKSVGEKIGVYQLDRSKLR